jgi:RNA-binding motif X-linked protein 2
MNNIRNIESITEQELNAGIYGGLTKGSWHEEYKDSAWVFFGGFPLELSEGDIICVMSQWGEIEDINLVRDKVTNKSKGFAFVKYEDNRSTILAVDNFNGMKLLGRTLRCDHVQEYRLPKEVREKEMEALENNPAAKVDIGPGHAYKHIELADDHDVVKGVDLWRAPKPSTATDSQKQDRSDEDSGKHKKHKKEKKEKKDHKEKKAKHHKDRKEDSQEREEKEHSRSRRADSRDRSERYDREPRSSSDRDGAVSSASRTSAVVVPAAVPTTTSAAPRLPLSSTSAIPASFMNGAVASWRGSRDPTASVTQVSGNKRPYEAGSGQQGGRGPLSGSSSGSGYAGSAGSGPRRDMAPSGIGGASRIR